MLKSGDLFQFQHLFKPRKSKKDGNKDEDLFEEIVAQVPKQFTFETLFSATEGFHEDHMLGRGGFGSVYKGKLPDGSEIAVKKRSQISKQGKEEFMNEAKLLASANHRNVVKLLGFCLHRYRHQHSEEMLLVYEYVANGSLDNLLFNPESGRADALDWNRTFAIIVGIARGLHYLHEESHDVIIHRDIKAANILINESWVPKIADFGMAYHFPQDQTHANTSQVAGTIGYMAPEYLMHQHLSTKADTYSFGVVVLELISGEKNGPSDAQNLPHRVNELYKKGKSLEVMDPKLASSAVSDEVELCVRIGVMCTQNDPQPRPTMGRVVLMLSGNRGYTSSSCSGELANSTSSGLDIQLENMGVGPKQRRQLDRAAPVREENVPFYISSIPSSSSGVGGIQIESEQAAPPAGTMILTQSENRDTLLEEPMSGKLHNSRLDRANIHLENLKKSVLSCKELLPKQRPRLDCAAPIRLEDVPSYKSSIPSSSRSGGGIRIQAPLGAVHEEEEEEEEGIPIPIQVRAAQPALRKVQVAAESSSLSRSRYSPCSDDMSGRQAHNIGLGQFQFQTKRKLWRRNTSKKASSARHSRKTPSSPPASITKQTKEAAKEPISYREPKNKRKKVAEQQMPTSSLEEPTKKRKKMSEQQMVEAAREHPTIIDIEERPINMGNQVGSPETAFGITKAAFFLAVNKIFKMTFQSSISISFRPLHIVYFFIMVMLLVMCIPYDNTMQEIRGDKEILENALLEKTALADEAKSSADQAERALLAAHKKAADAEENFVQAITELESVRKHSKGLEAKLKSLNDERNKACKCEGFQKAREKKYKARLPSLQDVIFKAGWEAVLKKVGGADNSPLFSKVPLLEHLNTLLSINVSLFYQ